MSMERLGTEGGGKIPGSGSGSATAPGGFTELGQHGFGYRTHGLHHFIEGNETLDAGHSQVSANLVIDPCQ